MDKPRKLRIDPVTQKTMDAALIEFTNRGKVTTVRCDACGSLIELDWLGKIRTAVSMRCSCGKYNGTLRGLLSG